MACMGISSLSDLVPSWLKHLVAIASSPKSPNRPDTSSSRIRNNPFPEGNSPPASARGPLVSRAPLITKPLYPPVAHLPASSKPVTNVDEYERWKPFSYNQIASLPMTRSPEIKKFLKYIGVRYQPGSPYHLWLLVKYDNSTMGYAGVSSHSFNANELLQRDLKDLVPKCEWEHLQQKYGFGFVDPML